LAGKNSITYLSRDQHANSGLKLCMQSARSCMTYQYRLSKLVPIGHVIITKKFKSMFRTKCDPCPFANWMHPVCNPCPFHEPEGYSQTGSQYVTPLILSVLNRLSSNIYTHGLSARSILIGWLVVCTFKQDFYWLTIHSFKLCDDLAYPIKYPLISTPN
jgi:hypothetical protein